MGCYKPDFIGDGSRVSGFGSGPEDQLRFARLRYEQNYCNMTGPVNNSAKVSNTCMVHFKSKS